MDILCETQEVSKSSSSYRTFMELQDILDQARAVFFDANGTLFTYSRTMGEVCEQICGEFGVDVPVEKVDELVPVLWEQHNSAKDDSIGNIPGNDRDGIITWKKFTHRILAYCLPDPRAVPVELEEAVRKAFAERASRSLATGALDYLMFLKKSGYTTGIISNASSELNLIVEAVGLKSFCDFVFSSSEIGHHKPSPKIFEEVAKKVGISAERCLYIGDDMAKDYQASRAAGWLSILYSQRSMEGVITVPSFTSLLEIHQENPSRGIRELVK